MTSIDKSVRIEDLQRSGKGSSRVVTVKQGREVEAGQIAERSGADVLPFKVGSDQMYLAGRGLRVKGLQEGRSVAFQGKTGVVNGVVIDRNNSYAEGFNAPGSTITMTAGIAGGAGVGLGMALIGYIFGGIIGGSVGTGTLLSLFLTPTIIGAAIGFGFAMLGGVKSSAKRVNIDAFDKVAQ
jgi:hypothetical protein